MDLRNCFQTPSTCICLNLQTYMGKNTLVFENSHSNTCLEALTMTASMRWLTFQRKHLMIFLIAKGNTMWQKSLPWSPPCSQRASLVQIRVKSFFLKLSPRPPGWEERLCVRFLGYLSFIL